MAEETWMGDNPRGDTPATLVPGWADGPAGPGTLAPEGSLERPPAPPPNLAPPFPPPPPRAGARARGARLGPFELVRRLGEGATGEVWEAVDRRIDAPVALKLFAPVRGGAPIGRVMTEARASSRVVSDHVVYVREAGEVEGVSYIAMALCREETASDAAPQVARALTEEPPRSLAEAVAWGEQIARGVAAAHAVGVFHRDLKPDNVLVLPASRKVRIADFGLAPLSGAWDAVADGPLTVPPGQTGRVVAGTPLYMAPEQARGFTRAPDPDRDAEALAAIDVYGVGATLWALLAGRPPHAGLDEEPIEAVRARAALAAPPDLREVETRFPVPERLARIVARAMADDPADRYPSAAALAVDLACWRVDRPTSLDAALSPVRGALWLRRNPAKLVAVAWGMGLVFGFAAIVDVYARWDAAVGSLIAVRADLAAAEAEADAVAARAEAEGKRADAAADAAHVSEQRAESAEDHAAHLRRYASREAAKAEAARAAEALARTAEAEARASEGEARAAEAAAREAERVAEAAAVAARASERAAEAAADEARAAEAVARAAERAARAGEAEARTVATAARAAETRARAGEAEARAAERAARAGEAEARAAETKALAAAARADARADASDAARRAAEARADAAEAARRAAEARVEEAGAEAPVAEAGE